MKDTESIKRFTLFSELPEADLERSYKKKLMRN